MTENIFIQDKCTLRVFHIELVECVRADGRKKEGNERFQYQGRVSAAFSSPDAPNSESSRYFRGILAFYLMDNIKRYF